MSSDIAWGTPRRDAVAFTVVGAYLTLLAATVAFAVQTVESTALARAAVAFVLPVAVVAAAVFALAYAKTPPAL